ncbi:MAG: hypothetical protein RLZZ127_863 [Planctomycetota bacterium]|jgi:hypothetical protein
MPILRHLAGTLAGIRDRHRDRHRPTGHGFAIAERVDQLNGAHWDAVTAGASVFLGRDYLLALADAPPAGVALRCALIYREGRPVAALACQVVTVTGERVGLRRRPLRRLGTRVLVCGNLLSWGPHGTAVVPGEDPVQTWLAIGEALYRIRRAERLSGQTGMVVVKDLPEAAVPDGLVRLGYRAFATDPDMVLAHGPKVRDFAGYLAAMNAKYRKAAKDTVAAVERGGCTVEALTDLAPWAGQLHALYLQVHAKATVAMATVHPDYLLALARRLGPGAFRCIAIRRGDRLLGFVTAIRDGDTAVGYLIGMDYEANAGLPIYFRLLYAAVEQGLSLGCRRLSLGRTALEPKAKLGAVPEPLHVALRHRVTAANLLLGPLLGMVPHAEAPVRSVFRDG